METTTDRPAFQRIPLGDLRESKANPRQHFDQTTLGELATSIKAHDVITPILCRPVNGHFEIAAGHRRFRAAKLAGIKTIPAVVRDMSDAELLEILVTENLQREDVHPLEEAHGYKALMKAGYTVERIAERVARSEKYVYDRMKLLQLGKKAQDLFFASTITAGHAILLSRISVQDQDRAIAEQGALLEPDANLWDGPGGERTKHVKPVSVRELDAWIARHVRFDPKTADPILFTGAAAAQAEEPEKLIAITREAQLSDDTRDQRSKILGPRSWRSASGLLDDTYDFGRVKQSKTCDLSVKGVLMTGPGRGEVLQICIAKKKCVVHFGAEIRERKRNEKAAAAGGTAKKSKATEKREDSWKAAEAKRKAEVELWNKATGVVFEAIVKKIKAMPPQFSASIVLKNATAHLDKDALKAIHDLGLDPGDPETAMQRAAISIISDTVFDSWGSGSEFKRLYAKELGVDVAKILKAAAPPTAVQPSATKKGRKS